MTLDIRWPCSLRSHYDIDVVYPMSLQQQSVKWKWYMRDWTQAHALGTSKLREQIAQTPATPIPFALLPPSYQAWSLQGMLWPVNWRRQTQAWITDGLIWYAGTTWKWTAVALKPHSRLTVKTVVEEQCLSKQKFKPIFGCPLCLGWEMYRV